MRHLVKYIKGTQSDILVLGNSEFGTEQEVEVLSDANWADGPSRRSTSGGAAYYDGFLLQSYARTQNVVALSTCEAELLAISTATQEGIYITHLLSEINVEVTLKVRSDSSAARMVVARRGPGRMKHIQIRHLWLQEGYRRGTFELGIIKSDENIADVFTKGFAGPRHGYLKSLLGLQPSQGEQE
jgi:hypothetical protein